MALQFIDQHPALPALEAAFASLPAKDQQFAASLMAQATTKPLSEKQAYWVGELAKRATGTAAAPTVKIAATFAGVIAFFAKAAAHLKRPTIRLALSAIDPTEVRLSLAAPGSANPGFVYVRVGGAYGGKISPAGDFHPFKLAPDIADRLLALLAALGADPAGVAAAYGKATGCCCFCSIELTDERSVTVGYGPVCAKHYGLPWGDSE